MADEKAKKKKSIIFIVIAIVVFLILIGIVLAGQMKIPIEHAVACGPLHSVWNDQHNGIRTYEDWNTYMQNNFGTPYTMDEYNDGLNKAHNDIHRCMDDVGSMNFIQKSIFESKFQEEWGISYEDYVKLDSLFE